MRSRQDCRLPGSPDQIILAPEVTVNDFVTHTGHLSPWNSWILFPEFRIHLLAGSADDFEASHESALDHRVI